MRKAIAWWRRAGFAAAAMVALAGCSLPLPEGSGPAGSARAKAYEACRERADRVYLLRNPGEVYRNDVATNTETDAPFGASATVPGPSTGLSARYSRDLILQRCLQGTSVSAGGAGTTPAPAAKPAP